MERLAEIMSRWLYQSRKELILIWLKYNALTTNKLSVLVIALFGIVPLTVYFIISTARYSLVQIFASYVFVTLLFGLSILLVITWFKSVQLVNSNVQGFSFVNLSSSGIDAGFFDFTEKDVENLLRLVNGLPSKEKIIIREVARNKQSGNIRFLFTLLNLIVRGGILRMDTGPKESLNKLISNRFKFNNSEINVTTLPSSYSKWCSAIQDGSYDSVQIDISKALGIQ